MKTFFLSMLFASTVTLANAQETATEENKASNKLQKQFSSLKESANSYKEGQTDYKVVSVNSLDSFWNNVERTVKATEEALAKAKSGSKEEILAAEAEIAAQQKQIEALKKDNALKDEEVQKSDSISVLDLFYIPKQVFVIMMLSVIAILVLALVVVYFQFQKSKVVTDEKKRAHDLIDQELNEVKKQAREREIRLKRDLQTELNRIEELNQEISKLQKKVVA